MPDHKGDEDGGESYELGVVHPSRSSQPARVAVSQLVMPDRYHRALDAFLQGRGGSQDSDSDSDTSSTNGDMMNDKYGGSAMRSHRRDSLESLMREKKARDGEHEEDNDDERDLEAQPAWMRSGYISENNVLRVCVYVTVLIKSQY